VHVLLLHIKFTTPGELHDSLINKLCHSQAQSKGFRTV
jgi:hypothetical protein